MLKWFFCFFLGCIGIVAYLEGEEGLWPFNQVPKEQIFQKYSVELTDSWLEHVQKSSLRISTGGSGSFISSRGLILTNHHVGAECVHNVSTAEHNYFEEGFYAKILSEEIPCAGLYVDQLVEISDVTDQINLKLGKALSFQEKEEIRKEVIAEIKKTASEKTGLQPEVVSLYHGAKYHLYLYKRYTDVRLVMAPDCHTASFGGDIDNFEYPRFSLDVCFFRVYEQGAPLETEHYLKWSPEGAQEGEVLFVSGHPGKTKRMLTADHLRFAKEVEIPFIMKYLKERLAALEEFSARGPEQARIAAQQTSSLANAYKVYKGLEKGFKERSPIGEKSRKDALIYGSKKSEKYKPWDRLKKALAQATPHMHPYLVLEALSSHQSKLYSIALHLVRMAQETKLSNEKRLPEYVDTELEKLELAILSSEPVYPDLEAVTLEGQMQRMKKILGKSHPLVKQTLGKKNEKEVSEDVIRNTSLHDVNFRSRLYHRLEEVERSKDPLVVFARQVDEYARKARKTKEDLLDAMQTECYAEIAKQEFERYGESVYPDATFTLRFSIGTMQGYKEGQKSFSQATTFGEMKKYAESKKFEKPYFLPSAWHQAQENLDQNASLNFVSTHDIIGGNSGSPVINMKKEWVGLIFDGNAHSITWSHVFDDEKGRSISVHSQGIIEALKHIYHADSLVEEIQGSF